MDLAGKCVFVTGASRGIGAATAEAFAAAGAKVVLAARSLDATEALARTLCGKGHAALAIPCDVASWTSVQQAVAAAEAAFGAVSVMVNNAGVIEPVAALAKSDPDGWGTVIDVNLKGVFHGIRAVLPGMIARGSGRILTVGSGAAHRPLEGWSAYCASKAGALMLTRAAHLEAGSAGVVAVSLSPGTVATDMQRAIRDTGIGPVAQLDWSEHIPADLVGRALVWLASADGADYAGGEVSLRDADILRRIGP